MSKDHSSHRDGADRIDVRGGTMVPQSPASAVGMSAMNVGRRAVAQPDLDISPMMETDTETHNLWLRRNHVAHPSLIIHPVEYASSAQRPLVHALALAKRHGADLRVIHVISRHRSVAKVDALRAQLQQYVERHNQLNLDVATDVLVGDPLTTVVDQTRRTSADLLVVGHLGRQATTYWRPGVFAQALADRVTCATLMVPDTIARRPPANGSYREILCPVDGSAPTPGAVQEALMLAQQGGGQLTILQVLSGPPADTAHRDPHAISETCRRLTEEEIRSLAHGAPHDTSARSDVRIQVAPGDPRETILSMAADMRADLIVLSVQARGVDTPIPMLSTTRVVLRGAPCPVLLVPAAPSGTADTDTAFPTRAGQSASNRCAAAVRDNAQARPIPSPSRERLSVTT